jgi:hypothetical protein
MVGGVINAIPKPVLVAAGVIVLAVGILWMAYQKGYDSAVADYSVEAAKAADRAKEKQAEKQAEVNDYADKYYQALQRERERDNEINDTKRRFRALATANDSCVADLAHYRLFNEAADNPDLPENRRTRLIDEEADGLDAIQYSVDEYNAVAGQVNALIDIIEVSECFQPD